jgi:hypothetical protein
MKLFSLWISKYMRHMWAWAPYHHGRFRLYSWCHHSCPDPPTWLVVTCSCVAGAQAFVSCDVYFQLLIVSISTWFKSTTPPAGWVTDMSCVYVPVPGESNALEYYVCTSPTQQLMTASSDPSLILAWCRRREDRPPPLPRPVSANRRGPVPVYRIGSIVNL